jgi:hypothetical protein
MTPFFGALSMQTTKSPTSNTGLSPQPALRAVNT